MLYGFFTGLASSCTSVTTGIPFEIASCNSKIGVLRSRVSYVIFDIQSTFGKRLLTP